jgi:uncharacterized damage-inducible protein DinB
MSIKDNLLPEYDHEMAVTRRVLERVPLDQADWKPHPKSMSMGELASHIVHIPGWVGSIVLGASYDMAAAAAQTRPSYASTADLLAAFDKSVSEARAAIDSKSDPEMISNWSFMHGDKVLVSMPKAGVFRSLLLNHLIHHRGQCSVYIRLKGAAVPSIYGPSADEPIA